MPLLSGFKQIKFITKIINVMMLILTTKVMTILLLLYHVRQATIFRFTGFGLYNVKHVFFFSFFWNFAELLCLATLRPLWCVGTVRLCYASRPEGVRGSPRDVLSGGRETEDGVYFLLFFLVVLPMCLLTIKP